MYRQILMAVDGSLNAHVAAHYAIALAQACAATLFVSGVITPQMTGTEEGALAQSVGSLISDAQGSGVSAQLLMERGEVIKTLARLVRAHHVDLVMTASRREDVERRYFLHSVPQRLLATLSSSLIIIRLRHLGVLAHPRDILVPIIGGSWNNTERVYLVSRLARHYQARVIVFHSIEQSRQRGHAVPHETGARRVQAFVEHLDDEGVAAQVRIVTGLLVGEAIMQEAARHRHDLIVMGASHRSLFSEWRRGNPVEEVMQRTPCDLFVCRSRKG
jgi:nucleotide-binding universal stress UspA family protein